MKLHSLQLQAFGPFAGKETINFDSLSAQGLFLLNGPTGAGKTSILDAICYALYGAVPGARPSGPGLHSQHAAEGVRPWVELEFTAQNRRLRITRHLPFFRAKKRGEGLLEEKAQSTLEELIAGEWVAVASRNEEVGQLVTSVLGMRMDQFTRVVMLPQGEFAAFLRAPAKDRAELLQKLFGTLIFEQVESSMAELAREAEAEVDAVSQRSRLLRQQAQTELQETLRLVSPGNEAAGVHTDSPETPGPGTSTSHAEASSPLEDVDWHHENPWAAAEAWLRNLHETQVGQSQRDAEAAEASGVVHREAQRRLEAELHYAEYLQRHVNLNRSKPEFTHTTERLRRDAAARELSPALQQAAAARKKAAQARAGWEAHLADAPENDFGATDTAPEGTSGLLPTADGLQRSHLQELQARVEESSRLAGELEARLEDEDRAAAARAQEATALADAQRLSDSLRSTENLRQQLTAQKEDAESAARALENAPATLERRTQATAEATRFAALAGELITADAEVERAAEQRAATERTTLDARGTWLDRRQEQLDNTAASLARELKDGEACLVCGSTEHPAPARGDLDQRDLVAEEKAARLVFEEAESAFHEAGIVLARAQEKATALREQGAPEDLDAASARLSSARDAQKQTEEDVAALNVLRQEITGLTSRITEAHQTHQAQAEAVRAARSQAEAAAATATTLEATVNALLAGHESLHARHLAVKEQARQRTTLAALGRSLVDAREEEEEAENVLALALETSVFDDELAARGALLEAAQRQELEQHQSQFLKEEAALAEREKDELITFARSLLTAEETSLGVEAQLPVIQERIPASRDTAAETHVVDAQRRAAAVQSERKADLLARARDRVRSWHQDEEELLTQSGPLLARSTRLTALSGAFRGLAGENLKRMSLSTFVLAARLEQVAEAASERLERMSDGRYLLEHSDARESNGRKSGLGLVVLDGWTGQRRDTSSLSGGESFMASLSLALGLADVVQSESGGIQMDSLFVDEGFGTLDEQALSQVMDALEGLLSGGRTVGLVSHVPELKQRIPAQIRLIKTRTGSTIRSTDVLSEV